MDPNNDGHDDHGDDNYDNGEGQHNDYDDELQDKDINYDEYEINFEEVSENDDIQLLYAKLRASKKARQRADEDAKLLENRIKLLKQEEAKARKKISETKKRAKDILSTKKRNLDQRKKKKELIHKRQNDDRNLAIRNQNMKEEIERNKKEKEAEIENRRREEADRLRQEKREQEELVEMYRQQEQLKNTSMKQMIRNGEKEAEENRKREYSIKKAKARSNLDEKVLKENQRRMEHEQMVAKMEREELELIHRLQNTQTVQKAVYNELEEALKGGDIDLEKLEAMQYSGQKNTKGRKKK